jgi:NADH-quinone oxidoreductase subunit N
MTTSDSYQITLNSLKAMAPELVILAGAILVMTAGAFLKRSRLTWARLSAVTLIVSIMTLIFSMGAETDQLIGVFINDTFSVDVRFALLLFGLILLGILHNQVDHDRSPEYFGAILFMQAGAMIVAGANELIIMFLGLELVSMPTYMLLYLSRRNASTLEAATKYFFLSIFASAFFLYGATFLYGQLGITQLRGIATVFHSSLTNIPDNKIALAAAFLLFTGLSYRITAVPMHFYAPDVYEGSPYGTTAILSWFPKTVGFIALCRIFSPIFGHTFSDGINDFVPDRLLVALSIVAAATLLVGNTMALLQNNIRRLLAYSSIAHTGYLMLGLIASLRQQGPIGAETANPLLGVFGILYYLAAYGLMTLGAIAVLILLDHPDRRVESVEDLAGMGKLAPIPALILAIFFFSLAGIPPLVGFWGKFYVFSALFSVASREPDRMLTYLAIFAALNAAVGVFYYLRIVVAMYLKSSDVPPAFQPSIQYSTPWALKASIAACLVCTLFFGLFPAGLSLPAQRSAVSAVKLPLENVKLKNFLSETAQK